MSDKIFRYRIVVEAVDKPLKDMQQHLKAITDAFNKQIDGIRKTNDAINGLANTYKKFEVGKLAISGLSSALSGVSGIASKGIDAMKDFGSSALDAMQFRERSIFSLGQAFGDGKKRLQELVDIANTTTLDTRPVVEMANAFGTAFKSFEDVKKLAILGGDVLHRFPNLGEQYTSAVQKAGAGAMLEAGSDLVRALEGGYNGYKKEIAKQLGLKGKDLDNLTKVDAFISAAKKTGKLTGRELTRALVESLKAGLQIKNIGDNTIAAAEGSLVGAVSNFRSAFESLFITVPWEEYAGFKNLATFLNNITQGLNSQEVRDAIGNAFNDIFAPLKEINESGLIQKFFTQTLPPLIQSVGKYLKDAFGWFTDLLTGKVSVGETFRRGLAGALTALKDLFIYIGELVGKGFMITFKGGEGRDDKIEKQKAEIKRLESPIYEGFKGTSFEAERAARLAKARDELYRLENMLSVEEFNKQQEQKKNEEIAATKAQQEEQNRKKYEDIIQAARPDQILFNMTFNGPINPADAEHIALTVANKVKESRAKDPSSIKRTKGR